MKAYKRKKQYLDKIYDFTRLADQDIVIDIHESQMIPRKVKFEKFLMDYQLRHFDKYGGYLKF